MLMNAREYLEKLRSLDIRIDELIRQHDEMLDTLALLKSMDYTKDRVQVSPEGGAGYENTVEKVVDSEAEIVRLIDDLVDMKREAEVHIEKMEKPEEKQLLRYRYLLNFKFEQIAEVMSYTNRHIYRLHDTALESFQTVLDKGKAAR